MSDPNDTRDTGASAPPPPAGNGSPAASADVSAGVAPDSGTPAQAPGRAATTGEPTQPLTGAPKPVADAAPAAAGASGGAIHRLFTGVAVVAALGALGWAYSLDQRMRLADQEFAKRQQEATTQAVEARALARQAEASSRELTAKLALVESRVAEATMHRGQLEELMQALSRSRDENVVADIESALRVAQQQSAITGGVEPLVAALRQAEERLARLQQPRLERVRRAVLQDMDRVRAAGSVDVTTLTLRLDEVARQIDELPLVAAANAPPAREPRPAAAASAPATSLAGDAGWWAPLRAMGERIWSEARQLVRVTPIDHPEAALLAPDQALFLRENLKLRLLNARLSLLSRQFDTAQTEIRQAQGLLDKYFDRSSRRVQAAAELLKQTAAQSKSVVVPRPDATLAALVAAAAGR